jgi:predicted transcriptional regulator of viral defense system
MKWEAFLTTVADLRFFDLNMIRTLFPEDRNVQVNLHRWKRSGKVLELRRGLYTLSETYRKVPVHAPAIAHAIYPPSYLSLEWALSWFGVIPEYTVTCTSVTTRETRSFVNSFGHFSYRTVKQQLFHGYEEVEIMGAPVYLAGPEKALCDFWYLNTGRWDPARMEAYRFNPEQIDPEQLPVVVKAFQSPRMDKALRAWRKYERDN